jgi:hypothetical protein
MEVLQFIFRDFWTFAGCALLLSILVNGTAHLVHIVKSDGRVTDTTEFDKEQ